MSSAVTVGGASELTGLSADALRYYEDEGIIGPFRRDAANRRRITESDLAWIRVVTCMKGAGLGIADLRIFAALVRGGETSTDPLTFLRERRTALSARARALTTAISVLDDKIAHFATSVPQGGEAELRRVRVHGELRCASEREADIVSRHLPRHIELTRAEPGCVSFEVTATDDPLIWAVDEWFIDRDALEAHKARSDDSPWGRLTAGFGHHYQVSEET